MCGIVGFSGRKDANKLEQMLGSIQHRGPDDKTICEGKNFHLGMRRLAIIDLSQNLYPMKNETGTVECIFNGEIYNYQELREELKTKGHTFVTDSDSEVIVHGYEEWDLDVFNHLRGMFAIALLDTKKDEMILGRDRLGIKPLYYTELDNRIIFASEIKAIFSAWKVDRTPDKHTIYKFLLTRVHDDNKRTFFKNVKHLLPGHYMTIDAQGNYRIERYWMPKANPQFHSERPDEFYTAAVREQFLESMRLHLISDVPLGVNLSGGLDSSAVTSVASKLLKEGADLHTKGELLTFSAIHPGESIDESKYIDEVIKYTGAQSYKIVPKLDEFWGEIEEWMYFQEEPTISTAPYAYYTVMRMAKEHVTVLLSGQGGDELFAGYIPYFASYIHSASDARAYWQILRESVRGFDLYAPFIKEAITKKLKKEALLNIRELVNLADAEAIDASESIYFKHQRNLNARLFEDLTATTVPSLLRYEDKNSMAHSLESRVPFLDHHLVEFVMGLPIDQKIKMGWNRYVYRNAMKGLMPEKIVKRRSKVGFVNAEWEWLQAKADKINTIFESDQFKSRPYWQADKVHEAFDRWVKGELKGDGLMFWRILSIELWMRQWVDEFKRF